MVATRGQRSKQTAQEEEGTRQTLFKVSWRPNASFAFFLYFIL
jgi:hypothetical protein